jgi:hypothetical protein
MDAVADQRILDSPEQRAEAFADLVGRLTDRVEELEAILGDACEAICEQQLYLQRHRLGDRFTKKYSGLAARISFALSPSAAKPDA